MTCMIGDIRWLSRDLQPTQRSTRRACGIARAVWLTADRMIWRLRPHTSRGHKLRPRATRVLGPARSLRFGVQQARRHCLRDVPFRRSALRRSPLPARRRRSVIPEAHSARAVVISFGVAQSYAAFPTRSIRAKVAVTVTSIALIRMIRIRATDAAPATRMSAAAVAARRATRAAATRVARRIGSVSRAGFASNISRLPRPTLHPHRLRRRSFRVRSDRWRAASSVVRQARNAAASSTVSLTARPTASRDCAFRRKTAGHSDRSQPVIPRRTPSGVFSQPIVAVPCISARSNWSPLIHWCSISRWYGSTMFS